MSAPGRIEFGGTDEELERFLREFARAVGGWAAREPGGKAWGVAGGSILSVNPNAIPWRVRVTREPDGALSLRPSAVAAPWTRRKAARLVAFRQGQLADFLTGRLRGRRPEDFDADRLRAPLAAFGTDPAALAAGFAGVTASGLGALAGALLAAAAASLAPAIRAFGEVAARSRALEAAGAIPLPPPAELSSAGPLFFAGVAFLFGFPLGFFAGLVHAAALLAGEIWPAAARLAQVSFLFLAIFLSAAFFPFVSVAAVPLALIVPLGAHAGYTLAWSARRERVREGPRGPRRATVIGTALALGLAAALVPRPVDARELLDRLALFRDRALLGHAPGRALARAYYRYTLYAADPLKEFFSLDPSRPARAVRLARVTDARAPTFRALGFALVPEGVPYDVEAVPEGVRSGGTFVPCASDRRSLAEALDRLSRETFRGGTLREAAGLGWRAVYHAGPLLAAAAFVGVCCPFVAILYRAMSRRAASAAILVCLLSTAGLMVWGDARARDDLDRLQELRARPSPGRIAEALGHPSAALRHEAAYRAFRLKEGHAALAEALLRAADDPDLRVRLWACAALGKTGDPNALPRLLERLRDREFFVRYRAAEGLGFLRRPEAEGALVALMKEGSWYEGLLALEALRRIAPDKY
jgi:hypothetical protein